MSRGNLFHSRTVDRTNEESNRFVRDRKSDKFVPDLTYLFLASTESVRRWLKYCGASLCMIFTKIINLLFSRRTDNFSKPLSSYDEL